MHLLPVVISILFQLFIHQTIANPKQSDYTVIYNLADETPDSALIGNLADSLTNQLQASVAFVLMTSARFQFLGDFFHLASGGDLTTLRRIDRDNKNDICGPLDCCHLVVCQIDVTVIGHFVEEQVGIGEAGHQPRSESHHRASSNQFNVHVLIRINDANDNAPRFLPSSIPESETDMEKRSPFTVYLREGDSSGVETLPIALDDDSQVNGVVEYQLIQQTASGHPVSRPTLNITIYHSDTTPTVAPGTLSSSVRVPMRVATPKLVQLRPLDYENEADRQIHAILLAIDGGTPPLTGSLSLLVHLLDINDNTPQFNLSQSDTYIKVMENTTTTDKIVTVKATDADSGENGHVTYAFSPLVTTDVTSRFTIDSQTGDVRIDQALDYEIYSERNFVLPIVAKDAGSPRRSSTTSIFITVLDANDNHPSLIVQENVTVPEGEPMSKPALKFYVKDEDEISQRKVICNSVKADDAQATSDTELMAGDRHLRIHAISNTVFFVFIDGLLDYETTPRASTLLDCIDQAGIDAAASGDPRGSKHRFRLTVAVGDRNDNAPQFERERYYAKLSEHAAPGTFVVQVTAVDADSGEFGQLSYQLGSIASLSQMQTSLSGVPQSTYGDKKQAFIIDPNNGQIEVLHSALVDRELTQQMMVQVLAQDKGGLVTTTELLVELTDINDCSPNILGMNEFILPENQRVDTFIGRLHFVDRDKGKNARIHLMTSLSMGTEVTKHIRLVEDPRFQYVRTQHQAVENNDLTLEKIMDENIIRGGTRHKQRSLEFVGDGEVQALLVSQMPVDREMYATLFFEVIAFDEGDPVLSVTTTITIHIGDQNDNDPAINFPLPDTTVGYHPPVYVNSPRGTFVTQTRATDPDQNENGTIVFHLSPATNGSRFFSVNRTGGELTTMWTSGANVYKELDTFKDHMSNQSIKLTGDPTHLPSNVLHHPVIPEPLPGLYYLEIVASDTGVTRRQHASQFFVHVGPKDSNTVNNNNFESSITAPFSFRAITQKGLGSQLMLALLIVIAFLSAISLICIILWIKVNRSRRKPGNRLKNLFPGGQVPSESINRISTGSNLDQYVDPGYLLSYPHLSNGSSRLFDYTQHHFDNDVIPNFQSTLLTSGHGDETNLNALYEKSVLAGCCPDFRDILPQCGNYIQNAYMHNAGVGSFDSCIAGVIPMDHNANHDFPINFSTGATFPHPRSYSIAGHNSTTISNPLSTLAAGQFEMTDESNYRQYLATASQPHGPLLSVAQSLDNRRSTLPRELAPFGPTGVHNCRTDTSLS